MLGKRAGRMLEEIQLPVETTTSAANCSGCSYVTDRIRNLDQFTRASLRLSEQTAKALSSDVTDSRCIFKRRPCATRLSDFQSLDEWNQRAAAQAFETNSSRSSSPGHVGKRPYDVMSFVRQPQHTCAVSRGIRYHQPTLSEEDVQEQKEKGEDKEQQASPGNVSNSASELSAAYFSGDSDLTAEHMAEGSSRSSSLEGDGCTLTLESAAAVAESLSKGSKPPEKQPSGDASFSFSVQGAGERQIQQQSSSTSADRPDEGQQFSFHTLTAATENALVQRANQITQVSGVGNVASGGTPAAISPTHATGNARQEIAEREESWLQLRLGHTFSESPEVTIDGSRAMRLGSADLADPRQDALVTLQLLPQKSELPVPRSLDVALGATRSEEELVTIPKYGGDALISFIPSGAARPDSAEVGSTRYTSSSDVSPRFGSFTREGLEPLQSFIPHVATPYTSLLARMDLTAQEKRPLLPTGDHYSVANRSSEFYLGPRYLEQQQEGTMSTKHSEYPYEPQNQSPYSRYPEAFTEDRSHKAAATAAASSRQSPMISMITRDMNQEYPWQSVAASNRSLPPWPGYLQQEPNRIIRESEMGAAEPGMAQQQHSLTSLQGGDNITSEQWQGLVKRFSTNLHFQSSELDDSLLPGGGRFRGNVLPVHDMTALQQAIDRFQSSRSTQAWDNRGTACALVPQWNNNSSLTSSLVRPNAAEFMSGRLLPGGLVERTAIASRFSKCEPPRSFQVSPTQANFPQKLDSQLEPLQEAFSMEDHLRLASPSSRASPGVWFSLQAAQNHDDDRDLPQMPKIYLRIKDGDMPISIVKKYLVTKLGLSNDSEVEITCKGKILLPTLTLQYVRDKIWFAKDLEGGDTMGFRSCDSYSSNSKEHIMVLFYQRHSESITLNLLKS